MVKERVKIITKNNQKSLEDEINEFLASPYISELVDIKVIELAHAPTEALVIYLPRIPD